MENQEQVIHLHTLINDVFLDLMEFNVTDEYSRHAREKAVFDVIKIRRHVEAMGLRHHAVVDGGENGEK